jgi:hypothetical protein
MGLLFLDKDARMDGTPKRRSTFDNAFPRLRLFTGRSDPAGRGEQFERLYLLLVDANPFNPVVQAYHVSDPSTPVALDDMMAQTRIRRRAELRPLRRGQGGQHPQGLAPCDCTSRGSSPVRYPPHSPAGRAVARPAAR